MYLRNSEMILYFYYKNFAFTIPQFIFGWYCAFSGTSIWDDYYVSFFNLIFTSIPLMVKALLEHDIHYKYDS